MSANNLHDRIALVTGAARGLGLRIAEELAKCGMHIAAFDLRGEELVANMKTLESAFGIRTLSIPVTVSDERAVIDAVEEVKQKLGTVYCLINNAGIRKVAPVWDMTSELWDEVHSVNLRGSYLCTREVLRHHMLGDDAGRIVFISSIAGRRGTKNSSAYAATKWGIIGLAHSVAQDLKRTPIRVTVITPGRTETPMARESEQWDPDVGWLDAVAVARAVVFCIQQDSGTVIPELHLHHSAEL